MADLEFAKQLGMLAQQQETDKNKLTDASPEHSIFLVQDGFITFNVVAARVEHQPYDGRFVVGHPSLGKIPALIGAPTSSVSTASSTTYTQSININGKSEISNWLVNQATSHPTYIAIGTGSAEMSEFDTSLAGELRRFPVDQISYSSGVLTFRATRSGMTDSGLSLREIGLFNSSSAGSLFARTTFSAYTLNTTGQNYIYIGLSGSCNFPVMDGAITETINWLSSGAATPPTHISWGTASSYITSSTWSAMEHESFRNTIDSTEGPLPSKNFWARWNAQMGLTQGTGSIFYQSGLWNASTNGTLFMYATNPPISKNNRFVVDTAFGIKWRQ